MSEAASDRGERPSVFLHIGSPKTGTTFLQQVLWSQRELAAEQGVKLPLSGFNDHYLASLDLRGLAGPAHPPATHGMWSRLVADSARWPGRVLVSHELLAAANPAQARRATSSFGSAVDVHVVLTVRDLVRQLSAEWQEHVKHRSTTSFEEFVASVREGAPSRTGWFWRVQDYAGLAERWGEGLPPGRVHVVTVPPAGASPGLLWSRFAGLLGLDPGAFETTSSRSNTSLGLEQAEVLRRVNLALDDRLALPGPYPVMVKELLAHKVLAGRTGTPLQLAAADVDFAVDQSRLLAEGLEAAGVDVVGSLDELVPDAETAATAVSGTGYALPSSDVLLDESVAALADLLVEVSRDRQRKGTAGRSEAKRGHQVRAALIELSEKYPRLMPARQAWQQFRDRNRT